MQIPRDVRKGICVFDNHADFTSLRERIRWTKRCSVRDQSDPERNNHLSGMIPSVCDAERGFDRREAEHAGRVTPHSRDHSAQKAPEEAR